MNKKKRFNPFYILLVLSGIAFCLTACAYGVMAVRQLHEGQEIVSFDTTEETAEDIRGANFVAFMDENGVVVMVVELVVLGICTFAAIATDSYWASAEERSAAAATEQGSN